MNERIQQLWSQAEEEIEAEYEDESRRNRRLYNEIFLPKFAELIVQECAEVCYDHSSAAGGVDTHFGYGYKDCGDDIKRNFGVEL